MAHVYDHFLDRELQSIQADHAGEPDVTRLATLAQAGDVAAGEALVRHYLDLGRTERAERVAHGLRSEHGSAALQPFVVRAAEAHFSVPWCDAPWPGRPK